jgi:hypothetical protein
LAKAFVRGTAQSVASRGLSGVPPARIHEYAIHAVASPPQRAGTLARRQNVNCDQNILAFYHKTFFNIKNYLYISINGYADEFRRKIG